jgi:hypothetical protein
LLVLYQITYGKDIGAHPVNGSAIGAFDYEVTCTKPVITSPSDVNAYVHTINGRKISITEEIDSLHWIQKPDSATFVGTDSITFYATKILANVLFIYSAFNSCDSARDTVSVTYAWDTLSLDSVSVKINSSWRKLLNIDSIYRLDTLRFHVHSNSFDTVAGEFRIDSVPIGDSSATKIDSSNSYYDLTIHPQANPGFIYFAIVDSVATDTCTSPDSVYLCDYTRPVDSSVNILSRWTWFRRLRVFAFR